jgi:integrase
MSDLISIEQDERLALWADAFQLWLDSRRSDNTRRAYRGAWAQFAQFCGKPPWDVGKADVARWMDDMRRKGLSPSTLQQRAAAISSFYLYARDEYEVVTPEGARLPLHESDPAGTRSLRDPVNPYGKAFYLSTDEARMLLASIPLDNVRGLRDYALILFYLATGRRNSEVRLLQWRDFEEKGGRMWYRWSGKGKKDQRYELPRPVWEAMRAYAQAAGVAGLDDEYVFTALKGNAERLPNVGAEWRPGQRPLSMGEVARILKRRATQAGLDPAKIRVHSLRHTAAMLRLETGQPVNEISRFLAHSGIGITQVYLHAVEGDRDVGWSKVEQLLGL